MVLTTAADPSPAGFTNTTTVDAPRPADSFKSDYKQQVLGAVDIVDLIGKTVPLKRSGKNYVGLCPFHSEKSPSFYVDPGKQFFRCYGCKEFGNAIDFVIKRDRLPFLDAMRLLGDAHNIERPQASPQARQQAGQRQQLLDCCSTAAGLFQKMLAHPTAGAAGRAYLAERGFNDEVVQRFQIGLAVDAWDRLLRADAMRPFPPAVMAMAGLVKPRDNGGGYYDTFRNRLMFPIRDESGRVIAFGGRVLPGSTDKAKYLNSPETPLFSKSRTVFGLDLARQRVVESRTVAVVEGYADVVMAHQYGATNVVSVLGTALTEPHVTILRRFADRIVLLFDADAAGDTAVNRAVELFLTQPVEIAIASLPDGMDPDEYLLAHGAEAFDGVLKNAADALTFTWKQLVRQFNASGDLTGQQKAVQQYLDLLARARAGGPVDSVRGGSALSRVSRLTDIPVDELNRRFGGQRPSGGGGPSRPSQVPTGQPSASRPHGYGSQGNGYRPNGPGRFNRTQYSAGSWKRGGPIGTDRSGYRRRDEPEGMVDYRSFGDRPAVRSARESAERWILAVLLAEPGRWHGLVDRVHVTDFTADDLRRVAEIYWQHQQDEGEPVFNEFLDQLRAASEAGVEGGVDLAGLAVELVADLDAMTGPSSDDKPGMEVGRLLTDAVSLLEEMRAGGERDKLVADLRRTSDAEATTPPAQVAAAAAESLRQLQERARRPDLRRVGS
jgi:DNA primase catalytic core